MAIGDSFSDYMNETFTLSYGGTMATFSAVSTDWIDTHSAEIIAAYAPTIDDRSAEIYTMDHHGEGSSVGPYETTEDLHQPDSDAVFFKIETKCLVIGSFYCGSFCR